MSSLKIDVYDLTGREYCYRYTDEQSDVSGRVDSARLLEDQQGSTPERNRSGCRRLDNLLIYPRNENSNREPYLQDFKNPAIEDFDIGDGEFNFGNSKFLYEILDAIEDDDKNALWHLKKYFAAQTAVNDLKLSEFEGDKKRAILLVPDRYSSITQEKILAASGLRRDETFLLWRSVAACLGAENFLKNKGVREGDKVAIIDIQQRETAVSILSLKKNGDYLVPKRKAFLQEGDNPFYPVNKKINRFYYDSEKYSQNDIEFYEHIYGRLENDVFLPAKNAGWQRKHIAAHYQKYALTLNNSDIKFFIVIGDNPQMAFNISLMTEENTLNEMSLRKLDGYKKLSFVADGAAKFCVRKENNLPTYFDECQALSIIVNDTKTENVAPRTLIKAREDCRGGEKIIGEEVRDVSLLQGTQSAEFYLCLGEATQTAKLKYLKQEFTDDVAQSTQRLLLKPTMIPGQGLANVSVQCLPKTGEKPLFEDEVSLNWLGMENSKETIVSLSEKTERTFPPEIPDVQASQEKWNDVKYDVERYLSVGKISGSGLFSKSQWNTEGSGKTAKLLGRINVFGIGSHSLPPFADKTVLEALFEKLRADFETYYPKSCYRANTEFYLRLIAWTYQRENPVFDYVKEKVMFEIKRAARDPKNTVKAQFYTFCANFLYKKKDVQAFFDLFLERMSHTQDAPMNWCRGLGNMLMFNNTMLENISTEKCQDCMEYLCRLYEENKEKTQLPKPILMSILFLLRKRRDDANFCKKDSPNSIDKELYETLFSITDVENSPHQNLLDAIKGYLIGKGGFLPIADLTDA